MILLNIYVATVIFAIIGSILVAIESNLYAKENGIVLATRKSVGRQVFDLCKIVIQCAIPLYNLLVGFSTFIVALNSELTKKTFDNLLAKGELKYREEGR